MQVYAASIMFGYFVRRVDKRFQLERSLGLLPQNQEEAVARLERLFSQVHHLTPMLMHSPFRAVSLPTGLCCMPIHTGPESCHERWCSIQCTVQKRMGPASL